MKNRKARIMRLVTYVGYCDEVGEDEYAANGVTDLLNTPGMIGGERYLSVLTLSIDRVSAKPPVQL